MDDEMLLEDS